jgi:23S rRNA (guanosine2251-2'-O)-methyltransferase
VSPGRSDGRSGSSRRSSARRTSTGRSAKRSSSARSGGRASSGSSGSTAGAASRKRAAPAKAARSKRSPAAEKAIASREARHAAASVRKADRPGRARSSARRSPLSSAEPRRGGPKGLGGDQVEGRQAVRELLVAGRRKVREVWVATDQDDAPVLDDIAELAMSVGVAVREVSRAQLAAAARTEAPQGVLARAVELSEVDLDRLVETRRGVAPLLLVADGVTDPGNLGALLRSAECAGITGVVLPRHRAVHITPTVAKAAAGAIEHLPFALVGGLPTAIRKLQSAGVWVVGLDASGSQPLFGLDLSDRPVALVVGSEGSGLSRLVRDRCDVVARIPLVGRLESLNVAAAGALACFEVARQRLPHGEETR